MFKIMNNISIGKSLILNPMIIMYYYFAEEEDCLYGGDVGVVPIRCELLNNN